MTDYLVDTPQEQALARPNVNDWFLSLPEGRQAVLREDKWMLAQAAFEAGGARQYEHIGQANPAHPHRLTCKKCGATTGQVLRVGSDFFDCLGCGSFTYVKGVNTQAHRRADAPAWADQPTIEYCYSGGTDWCPLGPAERMKPDFKGVYRLQSGKFPVQSTGPAGPPSAWAIEHPVFGPELTTFPSRAEQAVKAGATVNPLYRESAFAAEPDGAGQEVPQSIKP